MKKFSSFNEAANEAEKFFKKNFKHKQGVGVESAQGSIIEFYSKDDPSMDDTFTCIVDDGKNYFCKNGGELKIS